MDGCGKDVEQVGDSVMGSSLAGRHSSWILLPLLIIILDNRDVENIFFGILKTNLFFFGNLVKQTLNYIDSFNFKPN